MPSIRFTQSVVPKPITRRWMIDSEGKPLGMIQEDSVGVFSIRDCQYKIIESLRVKANERVSAVLRLKKRAIKLLLPQEPK